MFIKFNISINLIKLLYSETGHKVNKNVCANHINTINFVK